MAQVSISKIFTVLVIAFVAAASVASAQEFAPAPAPAPMDAGSGFSLPVSGAVVGGSILVSLFTLMKH